MSINSTCIIPDCSRTPRGRGLCNNHYNYHLKHGLLDQFRLLPKQKVHVLSHINQETKKGICTFCGPVNISLRPLANGSSVWRCHHGANLASQKRQLEISTARAEILEEYCEICGITKGLVFDHNHATGLYRGTLCGYCNKAIGFLNDDPLLVQRAFSYLTRPIPENAPRYRDFTTNGKRASRPLRQASLVNAS
jgi:hypothetical protein